MSETQPEDDQVVEPSLYQRPLNPRVTLGVVLAGGRSRRMGANKATLLLKNERLVDRAIRRLEPQVQGVVVSAPYGLTVSAPAIADTSPTYEGPLAGLIAVMDWTRRIRPDVQGVLTVPVDVPFFPEDLAIRLVGRTPAIIKTGGHLQPTLGYWPLGLLDKLQAFFRGGGRALGDWAEVSAAATVMAPEEELFMNINTPEDLAAAREFLTQQRTLA